MNLNIFQWRSLKTKVTLFTLAIFVISIWSLAFYVSRMLREDMQRMLGEQQFATVSLVATEINEELEFRVKALETVARSIDRRLLGSPAAVQQMLDARPVFLELFNSGVIAVTLDGTAVADAPVVSNRRGTNYFNNEATHIALTEGKTVIGRPVVGRVLHEPLFNINTPIRDADGKVIGALFGVINLAKPNFLDAIASSSYGKTGGYLLNAPQYRLTVAASDKSRIMQPLPAPGVNQMLDRYMHGFEGYGIAMDSRGVEMLNAAKGVPVAAWFVATVLPTAEAFAPIRAMQQRMLLATIFLTLLAGGLTWWMLKRQFSPMLAAVHTLATRSSANLPPQPLPISTQDEIGELIGGFNRLLETLRQREEALEWESKEQHRTILQTAMDGFWLADTQGRLLEVNEAYCLMSGYSAQELLSMRVTDLETKEAADETAAHMKEIVTKGEDRFESRHHRKDGSIFDVEVCVQYRPIGGGRFVVFIQDITERKRSEAQMRAQLRLMEMGQTGSADELMQAALDAAEKATGSQIGFFHFVDADQEHLTLQAWSANTLKNMCTAEGKGLHYPISEAEVWVDCFRTRAPVIHNDYASVAHKKGMPEGHAKVTRELVVPIIREGKVTEIMGVGNKATDYDQKDIEAMQLIASITQDLLSRQRAEQELRHSQQELRELSKAANEAVEAERRRTARELHDELGQLLTALKMDVDSLRSALPPNQPDLAKRAEVIDATLDTMIAATRRIAADLRPLMLDDLGLDAALDWLAQNFSKRTGIATDLVIDEAVAQVPEPIALALYRITQESLTNVAKYAQATVAEIRLERDGDWVELSVRDDGRGILAADQGKRGAFGLLGIRERVTLLGGEVAIKGEPGQGSEVRVRIPLAAAGTP